MRGTALFNLKKTLKRSRESWFGKVKNLFAGHKIDEELWEELEQILIAADVGVSATCQIIERVKERAEREKLKDTGQVYAAIKDEMIAILTECSVSDNDKTEQNGNGPAIVLVVGANGVGKTTAIAKLAHMYKKEGKRVILAAGDTFRAAAIDQLKIWGDRLKIDVVSHQPGADPGAVVYDSVRAATSRGHDVLIIDTAGRLHTKSNLMEELKKINRVITKSGGTIGQSLLVLDATTGQNGLMQAKHFTDAVGVNGIILTKLDGTAK
ncbi:MAG: signal recognition particle-docking protein FtsY, partial [Anaerolineales bacterium]|nr:signal recognition particle-docking protein FtsY [Anaerolineales bacterium]